MRSALVLIALLLCSACEEMVVLGTECPAQDGTCKKVQSPGENDTGTPGDDGRGDGGEDQLPPNGDLDAGSDELMKDAGRRDGSAGGRDATVFPIRDARPSEPEDAGPALYPSFVNPSFELVDGGREGPLPGPMLGSPPALETAIAPWYTCRDGTTINTSVSSPLSGTMTVRPSDGNAFITDTFPIVALNTNGITQELKDPLIPGQHYAFAVDLWAVRDITQIRDLVLEVAAGDGVGCWFSPPLASSMPIAPGGPWKKSCISFIAPAPLRALSFRVNAPGDFVNLTAAMHIDNIRPDVECGNVITP